MCLMTLEGHKWLSLPFHLCNNIGCYEGYLMISSYAKVLIPRMGQHVIYNWQERSLVAVNGIPDSKSVQVLDFFVVGNCRWISRFGIPII